ncbi:unnamed protein product [Alternaria alternata]
MAALLGLPNEALLRILHYLPKSVKHPDPRADLVNLSVTCKRLAPLAREILFTASILHPYKIDIFLATLLKYPDLQSKAQSLTLESNKIHGSWVVSHLNWGVQGSEVSSRCAGILHSSNLDEEAKQKCIQVLQRKFPWLGNQLSLVLILLPNLSSLSLGGSQIFDLTFLRPVSDQDSYLSQSDMDYVRIPPQLSAKLTFRELRSGFCHYEEAKESLSTFFPELRHLVLSSDVVWNTSPKDVIPPKFETLVVTNYAPYLNDWINEVTLAQKTIFPSLCGLSLYYGNEHKLEYPPLLRDEMKKLGITCKSIPHSSGVIYSTVAQVMFLLTSNVFDDDLVYEYVPEGPNWPLSELNHPWLYTRVELDAFSSGRRKEEMEKWTGVELEVREWEVGDWEVEESEEDEESEENEESEGEEE